MNIWSCKTTKERFYLWKETTNQEIQYSHKYSSGYWWQVQLTVCTVQLLLQL